MDVFEKAKEYANENISCHNKGWENLLKGKTEQAFIAGARWRESYGNLIPLNYEAIMRDAKKELINNAVEWLQNHVNDYLFDDGTPEKPWLKCKSEMFDDFKKVMAK